MSQPAKSDATTPCAVCGSVMKITTVQPLPHETDMMQHSFQCSTCGHVENYKFQKG